MSDPRQIEASSLLDLRFAWRWLLPYHQCRTICLHGFNTEERQFWETMATSSKITREGAPADGHVVDADNYPPTMSRINEQFPPSTMVAVVGNGERVSPWRDKLRSEFYKVREYGLISPKNPRIVVPLASPHHAVAALSLHRPGRWLARIGVRLALRCAELGNYTLLRRRMLLVATRKPDAVPIGAEQSVLNAHVCGPEMDYALYLGTPDDNRKTVVLPLGSMEPGTIMKIGTSEKARQSLKNEAAALRALRESCVSENVPELLGIEDNDATLTLYQEYRVRRAAFGRVLDEKVSGFLSRLSAIERRTRPLSVFLENMQSPPAQTHSSVSDVLTAARAKLQTRADRGMMMWEHRSHGDFAPWNCAWTKKGLFVYDWEKSCVHEVAFGDAFHYVIAPALLLKRKPDVEGTVDAALCLAKRVASASGLGTENIRVYLTYWLMRRATTARLYARMLQMMNRNL